MGPEPRPKITVLVADDECDIRRLAGFLLEADGRFDVVGEAVNGVQACVLARRLQPDAVVLDVSMPVMDGSAALDVIRAVAPRAAVVAFSALPADDPRLSAVVQAADGYVSKTDHAALAGVLYDAWAARASSDEPTLV